ncbi:MULTISPECIES: hypothetical protein [Flavobacterium]|uniref:Uncharacterized protein n=1 Tax=Flavobacterium endoglycinae TaxID=2816357 RepID=A0ABX7QFB1_9FLAO|nr:hypothetical protein [Flavobacterium endoglycinae]QSW89765.1 hypothetical protein J0383_02860 [Flavobacterium endoglycinae]
MKKYASLLFLALLLNGCDDGDLTVDTIDFDAATAASCPENNINTLIYKTKSQESLILQLPLNSIPNDATPVNDSIVYDINNSTYRVVYRAYDGTVGTENICGTIPPRTPNITEEWQATAGKIVIKSIANIGDPSPTDGSTRITGYTHNIVFRNITFLKPAGPQTEEEFVFGDYKTSPENMSFTFPENASQCSDKKNVYNFNSTSYLMVSNLDADLIVKQAGTRSAPISSTTNKVNYTTFKSNTGTLTSSYFCVSPVPSTPTISGTWDGTTDTSGTIEVTTVTAGTTNITYTHTITLKNVTLKKGNTKFFLANSFVLGTITETSASN